VENTFCFRRTRGTRGGIIGARTSLQSIRYQTCGPRLLDPSTENLLYPTFHGGGGQNTPLLSPARRWSELRRRPVISAVSGVGRLSSTSLVRAVARDRQTTPLAIGTRFAYDCRQPRRLAGRFVLRRVSGTTFPSGPLGAIASFGTVEGHSLCVGTRPGVGRTK